MGYKRKKSEGELEPEIENDHRKKPMMQKEEKEILPSTIKNKEKRSEVHAKLKHQKKLEKRKKAKARDAAEKRALELGEEVYNLFVFTHFLTAIADFLIKLFFFVCLVLLIIAAAAEDGSSYHWEHPRIWWDRV